MPTIDDFIRPKEWVSDVIIEIEKFKVRCITGCQHLSRMFLAGP